MATQPMVGCRVPAEWKARLEALAAESGKNTAQIVHEAVRQHLEAEEKLSVSAKIHEILQFSETLEANPTISSLSQRVSAVEANLVSIQRLLSGLNLHPEANGSGKVVLTSEELALILGVTSRAVNDSASKGKEHFINWTKHFKKGGKWTFEVINPGMKKLNRRFIPV